MIITADLYNTFIPGKRLATLLLTLAIGLLPILLSAQQIHDTLSINTGDNGEYAVNRHLYIYKTNNDVSPAFISESVKPAEFKQLFPANSFNDVQHPSNYYWLLLTVKNNLPYDETFYYQLNHPQLFSVIAYIKDTGRFFYFGKSGYAYPFSQKMYNYYDNVFPVIVKSGHVVTILLNINISNGSNLFCTPVK